jgi:hypothetical protein
LPIDFTEWYCQYQLSDSDIEIYWIGRCEDQQVWRSAGVKIETEIINSIKASPFWQAVILVLMCVETFKSDVIVFIGNIIVYCWSSPLPIFTPADLHTCWSSPLLIFTPADLHTCRYSILYIYEENKLQIINQLKCAPGLWHVARIGKFCLAIRSAGVKISRCEDQQVWRSRRKLLIVSKRVHFDKLWY